MAAPFGFLNAFKPPGPSSAAFGNWIKRLSGGAAVGHWGTLDPRACGVLVLGLGKATKLLPLIPDARKRYVFELVVGERTTTGDACGEVIERMHPMGDWADGLAAAATSLVGVQSQVPPMHSAVKVAGRPLYRSAREGREVARVARTITIFELTVLGRDGARARLALHCDAGTYVRVLCEDLGKRLRLPARMGALVRLASGPFALRDSVLPGRIQHDLAACIVDPLNVLPHPRVELDERDARRFAQGSEIAVPDNAAGMRPVGGRGDAPTPSALQHPGEAAEVLVTRDGKLLGSGALIGSGGAMVLAPRRVFHA